MLYSLLCTQDMENTPFVYVPIFQVYVVRTHTHENVDAGKEGYMLQSVCH